MSAPIIITVPNNYLRVDKVESKVGISEEDPLPTRKRRLDHLSWEEKMQRKKLKNRVAAQTSRDRKKAKMDEMEYRINHLEEVNERLTSEMANLKALNERLLGENAQLRAARDVPETQRPAEGRVTGGAPRGTPAHCDVPPLTDILASLDSPEYLDTLNQLAESLLQEINANSSGTSENVQVTGETGQCSERVQMVGSSAKHLESSGGVVIDHKHDIDRILAQHSYAHPYPGTRQTPSKDTVQITETENNDKGDMFYADDEVNDCITIEVPCEDQVVEEVQPISVETDFTLTQEYLDIGLENNMKLLSPMSLSPQPEDNLLAVSPAHTLNSDLGYESLASPLSESESMDLSDFWCDSFSELFPGLA